MGKHTPGPWSVDFYGDVVANGEDVARVATGDDRAAADARLIAAAPDLLAVVTTAVDMLEEPLLRDVFGQAWVDAAKSAIAKAKGESHHG